MDLKKLAKSKGTNLKQVAESCGIPPTTLYAISRGDTNFDNVGIGIAIKVAKTLGMTVEELYTGEPSSRYMETGVQIYSDDENAIIALYRSMEPEHKKLVMENMKAFAALSKKDGENAERFIGSGALDAVRA